MNCDAEVMKSNKRDASIEPKVRVKKVKLALETPKEAVCTACGQKTNKKKKKASLPPGVQRNKNAYQWFCISFQPVGEKVSFTDRSKQSGDAWKAADQAPFKQQAADDLARFNREMAAAV
jgi:hypothetical protein